MSKKLKKIGILPDVHIPYENKRAFELLLAVLRDFKPDVVVILGDFGDFFCVSDHDKNPNRKLLLDEEVAAVNQRLDQLDAIGAKDRRFIAGNHEDRLERYLMRKAPELWNLVKIKDLFKLKERGWTYIPYRQHTRVGKLYLTHEVGNCGAQAHRQARDAFQSNAVIGHTHRMALDYSGSLKGRAHVGAHFGWLGDTEQVDYLHSVKAQRDWTLGFGVGFMEGNGVVHLNPVPIIDYRCVVGGKLYVG